MTGTPIPGDGGAGADAAFRPYRLRELEVSNRIWVSPMCQYSAEEGVVGDWHLMHLGSLASGRPGLIMAESTGVTRDGRISPHCTGIWNEEQVEAWRRVVDFVHRMGVPIGLQLAHSGRKGSTKPPWQGEVAVPLDDGGWPVIGPSPIAYGDNRIPRRATEADLEEISQAFVAAAERALRAGFDLLEIHAAHGYLLHSFLSPLSNQRRDAYGGPLENRMRFPLRVAAEVRRVWPVRLPLLVRISVTDWVSGGWDVASSIAFATKLAGIGVDLVDCSSGGLVPYADIPGADDYQLSLARAVRQGAGIATAAVGRITTLDQVAAILDAGAADAVFLGRELLRNPHWPLLAGDAAGGRVAWPVQYERASGALSTGERGADAL